MVKLLSNPTLSGAAVLVTLIAFGAAHFAPNSGAGEPDTDAVSPALKISPSIDRSKKNYTVGEPYSVRSIDGSGNNLANPSWGAAFTQLRRRIPSDYGDGVSTLAGSDRPGSREISNVVSAQDGSIPNSQGATDMLWQWGQFVDHDIDLTGGIDPAEPEPIPVPEGDLFFDPKKIGKATISFNRSNFDDATGTGVGNPRQQLNEISAFIDASNVYGSDAVRAAALRTLDGTGRLKTSAGDLLPFNTDRLPNAGGPGRSLFLAGDVRANEQVGLTALHTLFVREHNRLADQISADHPGMSDEDIYQKARRIVGAQMQVITYNEFLPVLLGPGALKPYQGYDASVHPGIANVFSTAAYRFGHSMLNENLLRLDAEGNEIEKGHLALRDAFFDPDRITNEGGIAPLLRGLSTQLHQAIDPFVENAVRNFLFGEPPRSAFDLAALNIQRGRDHGLLSYNGARAALGLAPAVSMDDVSSDPEIQALLVETYGGDVNKIDPWVGGLAEDKHKNALVGELFFTIIRDQFQALRDGDRFWYALTLTDAEKQEVEETLLSHIIQLNTEIDDEISDDVFRTGPPWQGGAPWKQNQ